MRRSLSDSMYYGYLLLLLFLHIGQVVQGSGFFELQILQISNSRGELANGACCGSAGSPVPRDRSLPCPRQCNTFFRVCLKEYQSNVTSTGSCSFGNTSSPVLGGNSFALADPDRSNGSALNMLVMCLSRCNAAWPMSCAREQAGLFSAPDSHGPYRGSPASPILDSDVILNSRAASSAQPKGETANKKTT